MNENEDKASFVKIECEFSPDGDEILHYVQDSEKEVLGLEW